MIRNPNTVYVAMISYGKDSLAMLEAIKQLGYPLDRIIHTEIWATDTISADLPPMMNFKGVADEIIEKRYGLEVEHICAMKKVCSHSVNVERERESHSPSGVNLPMRICSTTDLKVESLSEQLKDFHYSEELGAINLKLKKLTYKDIFYRVYQSGQSKGRIYGFPMLKGNWCTSELKIAAQDFISSTLNEVQI